MNEKVPQPEPSAEGDHSNEHLFGSILSFPVGSTDSEPAAEGLDLEQMIARVLADPNVTQHVTRSIADEHESITGYFRCDFAADQERSILHVPLVPPLDAVPAVEAMIVDEDASARIRVTDRQKFGLRMEVVRAGANLPPAQVMVEVTATASKIDQ